MLTFHENKDKFKTFEEITPGVTVHAMVYQSLRRLWMFPKKLYVKKKLGQRAAQIQKKIKDDFLHFTTICCGKSVAHLRVRKEKNSYIVCGHIVALWS